MTTNELEELVKEWKDLQQEQARITEIILGDGTLTALTQSLTDRKEEWERSSAITLRQSDIQNMIEQWRKSLFENLPIK